MTEAVSHAERFERADPAGLVAAFIDSILKSRRRPSATELVIDAMAQIGGEAAWWLPNILGASAEWPYLFRDDREYCRSIVQSGDLAAALKKAEDIRPEISSTIDSSINQSRRYRQSAAFKDMVGFMARFRDYAVQQHAGEAAKSKLRLLRDAEGLERALQARHTRGCATDADPRPDASCSCWSTI